MDASTDRERKSSPAHTDVESQANDAAAVEDTRPGAKAGLTLTQFWVALFA